MVLYLLDRVVFKDFPLFAPHKWPSFSDWEIYLVRGGAIAYAVSLSTACAAHVETSWYQMTANLGGEPQMDCSSFPSDGCSGPTEAATCSVADGLFWAQQMASAFYSDLQLWNYAFTLAADTAALDIPVIMDNFPPQAPAPLSLAGFIGIFSAALGLGGAGLALVPGAEGLGAGISIAGTIASLIAADPPSSTASNNLTAVVIGDMESILSTTVTQILNVATDIFESGNISSFSDSVIASGTTYQTRLANFFAAGQYMFPWETSQVEQLWGPINSTIQRGLVGAALGASNYYIVKKLCTVHLGFEHRSDYAYVVHSIEREITQKVLFESVRAAAVP